MPHIFQNKDSFNNNPTFQTHSAILHTPYPPKVLIVGTYNETNIEGNYADFFYGRNYFWPVISNLVNNRNLLQRRRDYVGIPPGNPTLPQILELCFMLKLSFADLITDVSIRLPDHSDKHLNKAIRFRQATTNEEIIINYINETASITHVYATTKFSNLIHLKNLWISVKNQVRDGVNFGCILTPSGRRIPNFNGLNITATIARYWIWANFTNKPYEPFRFENGYTHLDHTWLIQCGVNPNQF